MWLFNATFNEYLFLDFHNCILVLESNLLYIQGSERYIFSSENYQMSNDLVITQLGITIAETAH